MRLTDLDEEITSELRIEKPDDDETLGIPRKQMPQIREEHYPEFLNYLKKHGVEISNDKVNARSLKPIQKEFNDAGVVKALLLRKNDKPVIASSDNYIIDGHHRWLGAVNTKQPVNVIRASIPVTKLLTLVKQFPKTYYKDIYDIKPVETPGPQESKYTAMEWALIEGGHDVDEYRSANKKKGMGDIAQALLAMTETASAGGSSAGAVASVANPKPTKSKQKKNKDGTAKNALDMDGSIFGAKPVKR